MLALSIRQPYAELIPSTYSGQALRGIKTVELLSISTTIVGERFYIYASKGRGAWGKGRVKSADNIVVPREPLPAWMIELAEQVKIIEPGALLPTGVIVGSAVIEQVSQIDTIYRWHLADVERAKKLRKPKGHPQPVWFNPF